jgi:predicted PurR-regulated permease PerM
VDSPITERGLRRVLFQVLIVIFGLLLLWRFLTQVATVALMLATGLLLAIVLSGPVEILHRHKVPRMISSVAILGTLALVLALGWWLLLPVLEREITALVSTLPNALSYVNQRINELANALGLAASFDLSSLSPSNLGRRLLGGVLGLFSTLTSTLAGVVVVVFLSLYLTSAPEPIVRWIVRLFPPTRRSRAGEVLSEIRLNLLDWLKGRLISMAIVGVLSIVALYLIGVPGALSLGLFAGLVSFVPYIGPIVSVVPPALLALAGTPTDALWVLVAYFGIQQVESYLLTPMIMEEVASIHPAVVIAAVAAFGAAFGVLGAILALPIVLAAGVLVEELWFRRLEDKG